MYTVLYFSSSKISNWQSSDTVSSVGTEIEIEEPEKQTT
jgi:hypothetical protein